MESSEVNTFLKDISNHVDNDDLSLEKIRELLRTKLIDLSDSHLNSKYIFRKTKNKENYKSKATCPWFNAECHVNKQLLHNK